MKRVQLIVCILFVTSMYARAQSPTDAAVLKPIHQLFLGMKKGDSALVHKAFTKHVEFTRIGKSNNGKPLLDKSKLSDYLQSVGTPHTDVWNEVIWDTDIKTDGSFAQVWAKFAFYRGTTLHHCGVDAFQLFQDESGEWKIFSLEDTHQEEGCVVPAEVAAKLK